jgi:hypothetical protein
LPKPNENVSSQADPARTGTLPCERIWRFQEKTAWKNTEQHAAADRQIASLTGAEGTLETHGSRNLDNDILIRSSDIDLFIHSPNALGVLGTLKEDFLVWELIAGDRYS